MADRALAQPTKRFFIEMLTRDIALEDAIVDLIDNSIDSILRTEKIDILKLLSRKYKLKKKNYFVDILYNDREFIIKDNCGGIDYADAKNYVFCFGTDKKPKYSRLSVYGIGLKRAVFKIGNKIEVTSKTLKSAFRVRIDVDDWKSKPQEWTFPLTRLKSAKKRSQTGTQIKIIGITSTTRERFRSGSLEKILSDSIRESYALFLGHIVKIRVNGMEIAPLSIPIGASDEITPSITIDQFDGVKINILSGLQKYENGRWLGNTAGWYVICNGRIVVAADKSELTGWGTSGLPVFQPKHRGFIGIVLFSSNDPESLPWTTTKRGINREAPVFQYVRERLKKEARPVIRFLDQRYTNSTKAIESDTFSIWDKDVTTALKTVAIGSLLTHPQQSFAVPKTRSKPPKEVSIQFKAAVKNLERAKAAIDDPEMSAGQVGKYAFDYFLENEAEE